MNHNAVSRQHAHTDVRVNATPNSPRWLVESYVEMLNEATGIPALRWKRADARRGRPIAPLGTAPSVVEAMLDAGKDPVAMEKPFRAMLAHIARRARNTCGFPLREALTAARKEQSEADVSELSLALSCANPDTSALATADKEIREAIQAEEVLCETIEQRLYAEKK